MPKVFKKDQSKDKLTNLNNDYFDDPLKVFFTWQAPSRPFKKKGKTYYIVIAIIVILCAMIAVLFEEILLIGVLFAIAFVAYVLGYIPPDTVEYKISSQGITIGDHFYFWNSLDSFWISKKDNFLLLNILTNIRFPGQLIMIIPEDKEDFVKNIVVRFLPYHEIPPENFMTKWADRLEKCFL